MTRGKVLFPQLALPPEGGSHKKIP